MQGRRKGRRVRFGGWACPSEKTRGELSAGDIMPFRHRVTERNPVHAVTARVPGDGTHAVATKVTQSRGNPTAGDSVSIPADLAPLIERTFRYTYMLATRMRDEMVDNGQAEELDKLVNEARASQADLRAAETD